MADHDSIVSSDKLEAIADAIREKTHKDNLMTLDEMPDEIASISGGGGEVPDCGIVPTSWSDNGYVLSADSYGSIVSGACYVQANDSTLDLYDYLSLSPNFTDSDYSYSMTYLYLKDITFQTVPEIIGSYAFYNNYYLELSELPEGVEAIGACAFCNAYNVAISEIPSTVTYIGNSAFSYSWNFTSTIQHYSNSQVYHIGDMVEDGGDYYVCVQDILIPEEFDYDYWYVTSYDNPIIYNCVGIYDSESQYSFGDVVVIDNEGQKSLSTMLYGDVPIKFTNQYCPDILGYYSSSTQYSLGDVVIYEESDDAYGRYAITCIAPTSGELDWDCWAAGDHPTILGIYDNTQTYNVGDVVVIYSDNVYPGHYEAITCVDAVTSPEDLDPEKWVSGGYPEISGIYSNSSTYAFGDTVVHSGDVYTCVIPVTSPETFDSAKWISDYAPNILEIFDDTHTYNDGEVVVFKPSGSQQYQPYTCWEDVDTGIDPSDDYDHWTNGYYPGMAHDVWSYTGVTHVGDIMYESNSTGAVTVVAPRQENVLIPVDGYHYGVKEKYDPTHQYIAGDVIYIYDADYNEYQYYVCKSSVYITGEFDSQYWDSTDSTDLKILTFTSTPETIESSAFSDAPYSMIRVPWSEGDVSGAPWGFYGTIVYDYNPEQSEP